MPGRLGRNLRRGHRAEGLGIELLRAFCAVAPVPQTEDFGFDAIGTVLRSDGRFWIPEDSFCVQFKAKSVREIRYDQAGYDWLRKLCLPLFIGSVDASAREVALYVTHHVSCRVDSEHYNSAVMYLDERQSGGKDGVLHQHLGPPILQWSHQDGESEDFRARAYAVLKAWVSREQADVSLRCIKTTHLVRWRTNEIPEPNGTMMVGYREDLRRDIEAATPYLMKIGAHFLEKTLTADPPTVEAITFMLLAMWLHENGADSFKQVAQVLASKFLQGHNDLSMHLQLKVGPDT